MSPVLDLLLVVAVVGVAAAAVHDWRALLRYLRDHWRDAL